MVAELTTPYRERHPNVRFTIVSRTSVEILALLENLEVDAGITYLDNEPLGRVTAFPFYEERYRLITSSEGLLGEREKVTWAEVGSVPLCLLTPDMQNRRIIDHLLAAAGVRATPTLESNSVIVLFSHVRTGRWASVMPEKLASTLGLTGTVRAIPIVDPDVGSYDRPGRSAPRTDDAAGACSGGGGQECRGPTPSSSIGIPDRSDDAAFLIWNGIAGKLIE